MILLSKIVFLKSKAVYTIARTSLLNKLQCGKNIEFHTFFNCFATK